MPNVFGRCVRPADVLKLAPSNDDKNVFSDLRDKNDEVSGTVIPEKNAAAKHVIPATVALERGEPLSALTNDEPNRG